MQFIGYLLCPAEPPVRAFGLSVQDLIYIYNQSFDIDNRMAGEYLGKSIGKIAGQTFSGPLPQSDLEL